MSWLRTRHLFAAYLNSDVHFTRGDFKQLRKLRGISSQKKKLLVPTGTQALPEWGRWHGLRLG